MKKEIADIWVAELRSGKYKQGIDFLKRGDEYCCLGVLCEIALESKVPLKIAQNDVVGYTTYDYDVKVVPIEVKNWSGMASSYGIFSIDIENGEEKIVSYASMSERGTAKHRSLAGMNDGGSTFEEIANFIEEHYKVL